jgi:hypothetical protein
MGEAIAKMTELEVVGRPSEQVAVQCSCGAYVAATACATGSG